MVSCFLPNIPAFIKGVLFDAYNKIINNIIKEWK